jgi:superfamily I DNA and RNA helicase
MRPHWRIRVSRAVRDAKIEIIGQEDIKNEPHADTLIAILDAYGMSRRGFVYVEPYLAKRSIRPHDILLCHPEIGVLVVEVKGHGIDDIVRVAAGHLFLKTGGVSKNAFQQVQTTMFDVKTAVERAGGFRAASPVFSFAIALPRISEHEWCARGYDQCLDRSVLLLKEDLNNRHRLQDRLGHLVKEQLLRQHRSTPIDEEQFDRVRSVFGDSAVLNTTRPPRHVPIEEDSTGGMIEEAESADKNLSLEQQELSRLPVGGHPRVVRGVAGSGKSVVLANMVARYLRRRLAELSESAESQSPRVGVVCFNKALVPFLLARIGDALGDDFEKAKECLTSSHFERLVRSLPMPYVSFDEASGAERATYYRRELADLAQRDATKYNSVLFDAIFVDEGQDFLPEEHQLLLDLVRPEPTTSEKPLIIFYDNAQNVYARPQPTWSTIGIDVARGDRTRVMKQGFRNSRQILEVAFNVLYGSQATSAVRTRTFLDVDTLRANSLITETPGYVKVHFAEREGEAPVIRSFSSQSEKLAWIAEEIKRLVVQEYVRVSDILVLFRTDYGFKKLPTLITEKLGPQNIKGFLRVYGQSPDKDSYLFREDHLTLSTVASAKGYDAPVVFLADVDRYQGTPEDRALFYVGATRAKYLLYLLGEKKWGQETLLDETRRVQKAIESSPCPPVPRNVGA